MLRNKQQKLPFLSTSRVQCPFFLRSLFSPVCFFAHYFISLLPSSSLERKLSSQLFHDEYGDRLHLICPWLLCAIQQCTTAIHCFYTAVKQWSTKRQPKHSSRFGFCHLFQCFSSSVPSLGQGFVWDLSRMGHTQNYFIHVALGLSIHSSM